MTTAIHGHSPSLSDGDRDMFLRFGIGPDLLEAAGVRRVTDREARELLGVNHSGDLTGVLYPRRDPESGQDRG